MCDISAPTESVPCCCAPPAAEAELVITFSKKRGGVTSQVEVKVVKYSSAVAGVFALTGVELLASLSRV